MTNDSLLIFENYNKLVIEAKKGSMTAPDYYATQTPGTVFATGMGTKGAETTKITSKPLEQPEKVIGLKNRAYNEKLKDDFTTGHYIPLKGEGSPLDTKLQDAIEKMTSDGTLNYLNEYKYENTPMIPYWNIPELTNKLITFLKTFKQEKNKNNIYATKELLKFLLNALLNKLFWNSVYRNSKPYLDATSGKSYQADPKEEYDKYVPKINKALKQLQSKQTIIPTYSGPFFIVPNVYDAKRLNSDGTWETVSFLRPETESEKSKTDTNIFQTTTGKKFKHPAVPPQETPTSSQKGQTTPASPEQILHDQIKTLRIRMFKLINQHGKDHPEVLNIQNKLKELQKRLAVNKKPITESFFKIVKF